MSERIASYDEFWVYYLGEHSRPGTRAMHYAGTAIAVACALRAVERGDVVWLLVAPPLGYLFAWLGHLLFEHNRPLTFRYPLWSLTSDFRMAWFWITGRLGAELQRHGIGGKTATQKP